MSTLPIDPPSTVAEPLDAADLALLHRCRYGRRIRAALGYALFGLFTLFALVLAALLLDAGVRRDAGWPIALLVLCLAGLSLYVWRGLRRGPASRRALDAALRGELRKSVVSGTVDDFGPAAAPGLRYTLDGERVDVALPYWNDITQNPDLGMRPSLLVSRADVPVRLHLLHVLPDSQPLLLRAEYPGTPAAVTTDAPMEAADRAPTRQAGGVVRKILLGAALVAAAAGFVMAPAFLLAAVFAAVAFLPLPGDRLVARATHKRVLTGEVDETIGYRTLHLRGNDMVGASMEYNYRVGGELYRVAHLGAPGRPGQRMTLEYLDLGAGGIKPLFVRFDGGPRFEA
ncbi:MAG: hypothetical protein REJ50_04190 [Bordetella sp.]|nr:hypothetical protein [Bordetella sp.]